MCGLATGAVMLVITGGGGNGTMEGTGVITLGAGGVCGARGVITVGVAIMAMRGLVGGATTIGGATTVVLDELAILTTL